MVKCATGLTQVHALRSDQSVGVGAVTLLLVLRAFASGAVALTGVEAISDSVGAFKSAEGGEDAVRTLCLLVIAISLILEVSYLAVKTGAAQRAFLSPEIARAVFPASSRLLDPGTTSSKSDHAILILAANTSYQGFPRLAAVLAATVSSHAVRNLGDRLVYSNGIIVLASPRC